MHVLFHRIVSSVFFYEIVNIFKRFLIVQFFFGYTNLIMIKTIRKLVTKAGFQEKSFNYFDKELPHSGIDIVHLETSILIETDVRYVHKIRRLTDVIFGNTFFL